MKRAPARDIAYTTAGLPHLCAWRNTRLSFRSPPALLTRWARKTEQTRASLQDWLIVRPPDRALYVSFRAVLTTCPM
jgi:hypothetical protein